MSQRIFPIADSIERAAKDGGDLVLEVAFASQQPYERWWGIEVLDVSEKAVRMARLNDGAPVLYNHNWDDLRGTHVPGSVRADPDRVLRGKIRLTSATQVGRDTIALVESGVLSKASTGYQIHKVIEQTTTKAGERIERELDGALFERMLERCAAAGRGDLVAFRRAIDAVAGPLERKDDEPAVYRVTDWEPLENSLVTVPADPTVGVGRMAESAPDFSTAAPAANQGAAMSADQNAATGVIVEAAAAVPQQGPGAVEIEQRRIRSIDNLCKANKIDTPVRDHWVGAGLGMDEITADLMRILEERSKTAKPVTAIGLSMPEARKFSLMRAVLAAQANNWTQAGFELECSREIAKRLNKVPDPNKFYVPAEVQQRDLTVGTASAGGYLVATDNMSFIELMRNRSVVYRMGARRLAGLSGNVTVPKQTAAGTGVWLANEASTATESAQTFGQLSLTPKTVGAYTEISRQLMLQSSPDAEGIVSMDLATVCALAIDVGALRGSGASGEPQGIVGTSGVGSVTGTSLAAAGILEFQSDVAVGNLLSASCGYVTTPAVAALLMARPELPSTGTTRLWQGNMLDGSLFGMRAMTSNQMSAATMLFGDFSQVIVGEWGVLEVEVNPYANFQAGIVGVRAMVTVDVGVRYGGAFSYASSIT